MRKWAKNVSKVRGNDIILSGNLRDAVFQYGFIKRNQIHPWSPALAAIASVCE
jgi:hypothetical protein